METWINDHIQAGNSARMTAGFCWPWKAPDRPPLPPEVSLPCHHTDTPHMWQKPWNLRADQTSLSAPHIPGRVFWATDDGGHEQVGCVYTAQGLEYDYGAVIMGPDLIHTEHGWEAHPEHSLSRTRGSKCLRRHARHFRTLALVRDRAPMTAHADWRTPTPRTTR